MFSIFKMSHFLVVSLLFSFVALKLVCQAQEVASVYNDNDDADNENVDANSINDNASTESGDDEKLVKRAAPQKGKYISSGMFGKRWINGRSLDTGKRRGKYLSSGMFGKRFSGWSSANQKRNFLLLNAGQFCSVANPRIQRRGALERGLIWDHRNWAMAQGFRG